jgi:hypothetical protein
MSSSLDIQLIFHEIQQISRMDYPHQMFHGFLLNVLRYKALFITFYKAFWCDSELSIKDIIKILVICFLIDPLCSIYYALTLEIHSSLSQLLIF